MKKELKQFLSIFNSCFRAAFVAMMKIRMRSNAKVGIYFHAIAQWNRNRNIPDPASSQMSGLHQPISSESSHATIRKGHATIRKWHTQLPNSIVDSNMFRSKHSEKAVFTKSNSKITRHQGFEKSLHHPLAVCFVRFRPILAQFQKARFDNFETFRNRLRHFATASCPRDFGFTFVPPCMLKET